MSGFWLAMMSAMIWGLSAFIEKWGLKNADPLGGVFARTVGIVTGCLIFSLVVPQAPQRFFAMDGRSKLALMLGGCLASVVAQLFFYRALKFGDIGRVSAIGGSWPVFAFVLSVLFYHEPLTTQKVLGLVLVMAGAAFLK